MKAYCINLERRPDRKENAQAQFENYGIENVEFFRATDGRAEAPDGIFITRPEWGCSDSHIRIWRDIVQNNHEYALIFEDDVIILPEFNEKLKIIMDELEKFPTWDLVNLGPLSMRVYKKKASEHLDRGGSLGGHCYMISQAGAQKVHLWNANDLHNCQDSQLATGPFESYYTPDPLANQESVKPGPLGVINSLFSGDIGFNRTADFGYIIKWLASNIWFMAVFFVALLLILQTCILAIAK
jgi:GR25 family glycosyltransferase involved in LPS biosynthesis